MAARRQQVRIPGHGTSHLIKPLIGFKEDIEAQIERFPYHENVFLMMKFRDSTKDLAVFIIETLGQYGLRGVRADDPDWNITNNVYNPLAVLCCCKYGIALFDEPEEGQAYSPNVAYELGVMQFQGKNCLILRHRSLPETPFDLIKDLHVPYDRDLAVRENIKRWITQILPSSEKSQKNLPGLSPPPGHGKPAEIHREDEEITASGFEWKMSRVRGSKCKIEWKLQIANRGQTEAGYQVYLVFEDSDSFLLHDHSESSKTPLKPGEQREFNSSLQLESDLAARVKSVVAHVSRQDP